MTLRMIEGFDHIGAVGAAVGNVGGAGWSQSGVLQSGSGLVASRWGATAGKGVYFLGQNNWIAKALHAGFDEVWTGFAIAGAWRASVGFAYVSNSARSAYNCWLSGTANSGGFLQLHNAAGTVVAVSTYNWDGGWHFIEIRVLAAGAAGTAEVWVDGVRIIPPTTSNYGVAGALTSPAGLLFQNYDNGGNTWYWTYLDDIYFLDTLSGAKTTRLGECRVETLFPTSDGAHTDFTPTTAGHFDEVDDPGLNDGDTTVVQSNVVGARDSYGFQDLSIASGTIHGLGVKTVARKNDAGPRTIKHSIRQGGTTYDGSLAHTLIASHDCYQTCWDQDPVSGAWTVANVNADEYGVKVES